MPPPMRVRVLIASSAPRIPSVASSMNSSASSTGAISASGASSAASSSVSDVWLSRASGAAVSMAANAADWWGYHAPAASPSQASSVSSHWPASGSLVGAAANGVGSPVCSNSPNTVTSCPCIITRSSFGASPRQRPLDYLQELRPVARQVLELANELMPVGCGQQANLQRDRLGLAHAELFEALLCQLQGTVAADAGRTDDGRREDDHMLDDLHHKAEALLDRPPRLL